MIAVIPIHAGHLPPGAAEAVAEADGRCLLIGSGVVAASEHLAGVASNTQLCEVGAFSPLAWAAALGEHLSEELLAAELPAHDLSVGGRAVVRPGVKSGLRRIVVPGSAGSRALAPHLALVCGLDLVGPTDRVSDCDSVTIMAVGSRSVHPDPALANETLTVELALAEMGDARMVEAYPADPATVDLGSARRIVAGGAGLDSAADLEQLGRTGLRIGASLGATRVLTDAGWLGHERQIGTTGVEVDPDLYITVGVSGAVQHVMGIGVPDHIISVNTDPSCPMMARSDLALVCDGPDFVREFEQQLGQREQHQLDDERGDRNA